MSIEGLPLVSGATGEEVRDLQQRLIGAGFDPGAEVGVFGAATEEAVRNFQAHRGLVVDGVCDRDTWAALVEAGYQLGDRLLYLRRPMLRGDDVGDLQLRLGALGFDAGRVDAIFGPDTEKALKDFQRNTAITIDGVCGPDVIAAVQRLGAKAVGPAGVAGIRERDRLDQLPRQLAGRRIAIGDLGGLGGLAEALTKRLRAAGADAQTFGDDDHSRQAQAANDYEAELYLGVGVSPDQCVRAAYYQTPGFESVGGHRLADLIASHAGLVETTAMPACGMRLAILRETRMPAVVCHFDPSGQVTATPGPDELADRLGAAITRWIESPAS